MIYFARLATGAIKIGFTDDLESRLAELRSYFGGGAILLASMPGDMADEREVHHRFRHLRFRGTEQFRPAAELMNFIGVPLLVDVNPETVEATPVSPSRRDDVAVKIDQSMAEKAKLVALLRQITLAEFLTETLRAPIERAYRQEVSKLTRDDTEPGNPKGGSDS